LLIATNKKSIAAKSEAKRRAFLLIAAKSEAKRRAFYADPKNSANDFGTVSG